MDASATRPFHESLRDAVERRGLSLERVSAHLRARGHMVSIATLSYWQSGRSVPSRPASLRAVGALEAVLGVPRGGLAHLVPTPVSEPPAATSFTTDNGRRLEGLAAELGYAWGDEFDEVALHSSFFVDERGVADHMRCRTVVRVRQPTAIYVTGASYPLPGTEITFTPTFGCALEAVTARPEHAIGVAALRLPMLRVGDVHAFEYEVAYHRRGAGGLPTGIATTGCSETLQELYVEAVFTPGATPATVQLVDGVDRAADNPRIALRHGVASAARTGFGPGRLGFVWELPLPATGLGHRRPRPR